MRYVSSAEIRSNPALLWKEGEDTDTIITVNGKPKVISLTINGEPEEIFALIKRIRAEQAIERMWQKSLDSGTDQMTMVEINEEIKNARKEMMNEL
ncbi:hypothetical protein DSECCO2_07820 [anaerobic digester metagenome]